MEPFCSEDDLAVAEAVLRFAAERIAPHAKALDAEARFAGEHLAALADAGLMGMNLPEAWGGAGVSALALYLAVEALAQACASTTSMLTAHFLATDAILIGGTDAQRARWLPDAATGRLLGAFALTEPGAGSNPADLRTRAVVDSDGYRLNGAKQFISNAAHADFLVVFASTDPTQGARGISAFVVDRTSPGLSVGPTEPTMGLRGGHVFPVAFEDVVLPADRLLGTAGQGFRTAMKTLDNGRIEIAATCTGIARAALAAAIGWAGERTVDGEPITRFQGLQWMLADTATELEAARLMGLRAAALRAERKPFAKEASMAKLFASEMAGRATDRALQIHGGYGYSRELPLERLARDVRIMRIYEGSSEIQRNIIARAILKG